MQQEAGIAKEIISIGVFFFFLVLLQRAWMGRLF